MGAVDSYASSKRHNLGFLHGPMTETGLPELEEGERESRGQIQTLKLLLVSADTVELYPHTADSVTNC